MVWHNLLTIKSVFALNKNQITQCLYNKGNSLVSSVYIIRLSSALEVNYLL